MKRGIKLDKDYKTDDRDRICTVIPFIKFKNRHNYSYRSQNVIITGDGLIIGKRHVLYFSLGVSYMGEYIYKNSLSEFIDCP